MCGNSYAKGRGGEGGVLPVFFLLVVVYFCDNVEVISLFLFSSFLSLSCLFSCKELGGSFWEANIHHYEMISGNVLELEGQFQFLCH